jgi:hypothetical protein
MMEKTQRARGGVNHDVCASLQDEYRSREIESKENGETTKSDVCTRALEYSCLKRSEQEVNLKNETPLQKVDTRRATPDAPIFLG